MTNSNSQNTQTGKQDFAQVVQSQIQELKQDVLARLDGLKAQFPLSQADLVSLKDTLKAELSALLEEAVSVSKELKAELTDLSHKHKEQITHTLKASKNNVADALGKINLSTPKDVEKSTKA